MLDKEHNNLMYAIQNGDSCILNTRKSLNTTGVTSSFLNFNKFIIQRAQKFLHFSKLNLSFINTKCIWVVCFDKIYDMIPSVATKGSTNVLRHD